MTSELPAWKPAAGWYPDPSMPATQRYWDGDRWTEHRAPGVGQAATPVVPVEPDRIGMIVAGYLFALAIPLVGFIIGCVLLTKRRRIHVWNGLGAMLVSIVAFLWWASAFSTATTSGY